MDHRRNHQFRMVLRVAKKARRVHASGAIQKLDSEYDKTRWWLSNRCTLVNRPDSVRLHARLCPIAYFLCIRIHYTAHIIV